MCALHWREHQHSDSSQAKRQRTSTVSKKMSGNLHLWMWTSFLVTSVKRMRDATSLPTHCRVVRMRFSSAAGGKRSNHKMLLGTLCRMRSHAENADYGDFSSKSGENGGYSELTGSSCEVQLSWAAITRRVARGMTDLIHLLAKN